VETRTGGAQFATPESESLHPKFTVTALVFQPLGLGAGVGVAVIRGGVLSRLTVAQAGADETPDVSVACPQIDDDLPSVATVPGGEQLASGYVPATQVKVTVTLELFQPALFAAGAAEAVADGGTKGATVKVTVVVPGEP